MYASDQKLLGPDDRVALLYKVPPRRDLSAWSWTYSSVPMECPVSAESQDKGTTDRQSCSMMRVLGGVQTSPNTYSAQVSHAVVDAVEAD